MSLHDQNPSTPDPAFRAHPSISGLSLPQLCPLTDARLCTQMAQDCCLAVLGLLGDHFPSYAPGERLIKLDARAGRFVLQTLPAASLKHIRERMPRSGNAPPIGPICLADGRGLGWGLVGGADRFNTDCTSPWTVSCACCSWVGRGPQAPLCSLGLAQQMCTE